MAIREPAPGDLNRRVLIRLRTDVPAQDLGLTPVFTGEKLRWASIIPVGAAVYSAGIQVDNKVTHRITLWFLAGMTGSHEILRGTTVYRVKRVADLNGAGRFTVLEVEELGLELPAMAGGENVELGFD